MNRQPLEYYIHDSPSAIRFELTGCMNGEGARRLEQVWRTSSSLIGHRRPIIDISLVSSVDEQGESLLARWYEEGAQFVANSKTSRVLAERILGAPLPEPKTNASGHRPAAICKSSVCRAVLLATLFLGFTANAGNLRSEANQPSQVGRR
ncbi:MAG TPA: hypothetical protein VME17_04230 [Bryobacteraceae bacterium]|nr:hypothetical protein [Bryobacteraceae bacterium]